MEIPKNFYNIVPDLPEQLPPPLINGEPANPSDLEKIFPKRLWRSVNYVVVRFGQTYKSRREKDKILEEIKKEK